MMRRYENLVITAVLVIVLAGAIGLAAVRPVMGRAGVLDSPMLVARGFDRDHGSHDNNPCNDNRNTNNNNNTNRNNNNNNNNNNNQGRRTSPTIDLDTDVEIGGQPQPETDGGIVSDYTIKKPTYTLQATSVAGVFQKTMTSNAFGVTLSYLDSNKESMAEKVTRMLNAKVAGDMTFGEYLAAKGYSDVKQRRLIARMLVNNLEPQQSDQYFEGVLYSWGDIRSELKGSDFFALTGMMVAYGGDPAKEPGSRAGKGVIELNAGNVIMLYDPRKAGLVSSAVSLKMVQWNSF